MLDTLSNEFLRVQIRDKGAELWSVTSPKNGTEYLWQGDPAYWEDRSPIMFPFCGRVQDGHYSYEGKAYPMGCHGFAAGEIFAVTEEDQALRFTLRATEKTREIYPFDFAFDVIYRLAGNRLTVTMEVTNEGKGVLPCTMGAHPGFRVPLDEGGFEDWYAEFGSACAPRRMEISEDGFCTGTVTDFPLENGRILRLSHSLFDIDGIFLEKMASSVSLRSEKSKRSVTLSYPDMPYLGFWQCSGGAPYLCVEPWCAMPAIKGESEDLSVKAGLFRLHEGESRRVAVDMIFD